MSKIKREIEIIPSSDEIPTPPPSPSANRAEGPPTAPIDEDDLQILSSKNASRAKYPPGCPVWHDPTKSSPRRLDARRGAVEAVYVALETGARAYEVKTEEGGRAFFRQDQLAFAMNCPVTVRGMQDGLSNEMEGVIVCPRTPRGDRKLSYSVSFSEGSRVWVELGVETENISYRKAELDQLGEQQIPGKAAGQEKNCSTESSMEKSRTSKQPDSSAKNSETVDCSKSRTSETSNNNKDATNHNHAASVENGDASPKSTLKETSKLLGASKRNNIAEHSCHELERAPAIENVPHSAPAVLDPNSEPNGNEKRPPHRSAVEQHPNGASDPPLMLTIARGASSEHTPFLKHSLSALSDATSVSEGNRLERPPALDGPLRHWRNPHDGGRQPRRCKLTIPSWVTESTTRNLFLHIIGKVGEEQGYKTRTIERETGCVVEISRGISPMCLTIRPKPSSSHGKGEFDVLKARGMVEKSLLEFVECEGARARLLYELAMSVEGASHPLRTDGIVQQRDPTSKDLVWMKLLDLPDMLFQKNNLLSFKEDAQRRLRQDAAKCSVEVYGHGLDNITTSVHSCRPFVLVCISGKNNGQVETDRSIRLLNDASEIVSGVMNEHQLRCSQNEEPPSPARSRLPLALGKRKPPLDTSSVSSRSHDHGSAERLRKAPRVLGENEREAKCILTVPLWVLKNCEEDIDLFAHLLGKHNGNFGHKQREMESKTNCSINLTKNSSRIHGRPMLITIKSKSDPASFPDVRRAQGLIVSSLQEFVGDAASDRRLVYELAINAKGTYNFRRKDGVVKQVCHLTHRMVWMKLLELPSTYSDGKSTPHGKFLCLEHVQERVKGDTDCFVEAYCCGNDIPALSGPYALVSGNNLADVREVSARVALEIENHQQKCHCRFFD